YTFVPTGNTTAIVFTGQDNQGTGDEYFGLDNIQVTGVPSVVGGVPEPATWAMLLFGFFGLGGLLRAQRRSDRGVRGIQRSAA
ncbi:MAG: PEPxxWA-CTERM sorting domain-containing protein, partial [Caulobacteraceae bacterium]